MYANGQGVRPDHVKAYMWWTIAAANGEERSKKSHDLLAKHLTPTQIAEANRLAREWLDKHRE
jgi:hypothetical protein